MVNTHEHNAIVLNRELNWFEQVLDTRFKLHFNQESSYSSIWEVPLPEETEEPSVYSNFLNHYQLSVAERLVLILSLTPHIQPQVLDAFFTRNASYDRGFTEFGGIRGKHHGGFLPTGETALFLLAGNDMEQRLLHTTLFDAGHFFASHKILALDTVDRHEPRMSGVLSLSREFVDYFTTGQVRKPNFNKDFPAQLISTRLEWDDLVLPVSTSRQLEEMKLWMERGHVLMNDWELGRKLRPGFRALFYGPPGTGKTMTACLLGKMSGRDVYKIDLSMVVSKYIGETEENLAKVFDQAQFKQWVLFFDEADALFGKRVKAENANDMHANQQVSYLLQRIESFDGVVILASNLKGNIDDAFTRRFEAMVHFPLPKPEDRLRLWQESFSKKTQLEDKVNLRQIAAEYELAGGSIMNVVRYASLMAIKRDENIISAYDLKMGIKKEFHKQGKTL